jgi:hypothetical protein
MQPSIMQNVSATLSVPEMSQNLGVRAIFTQAVWTLCPIEKKAFFGNHPMGAAHVNTFTGEGGKVSPTLHAAKTSISLHGMCSDVL